MAKRIYINPGHSDTDPGAVGYEVERELAVKVSNYQREHLLANYDCEVRMNPGTMGSLSAIAKDANDWCANLFVSNHFNAGGGDGYEALVYSSKMKELGAVFEKYVKAIGQNSRGVKQRPGLAVLKYTNMPAILNEGAFVDNKTDIADWNDDSELKELGIAYAKAAAEYLELPKKDTEPVKQPAKPAKNTVAEDGEWGKKTTEASQKVLGTKVDGIVSNQPASCMKYVPAASTSSWKFKTSKYAAGSALIKAIQNLIGAKADGLCGKNTVKAMQEFLKKKKMYTGTIDGVMGQKTVIGWQKYINSKM